MAEKQTTIGMPEQATKHYELTDDERTWIQRGLQKELDSLMRANLKETPTSAIHKARKTLIDGLLALKYKFQ